MSNRVKMYFGRVNKARKVLVRKQVRESSQRMCEAEKVKLCKKWMTHKTGAQKINTTKTLKPKKGFRSN